MCLGCLFHRIKVERSAQKQDSSAATNCSASPWLPSVPHWVAQHGMQVWAVMARREMSPPFGEKGSGKSRECHLSVLGWDVHFKCCFNEGSFVQS